MHNLSISDLNSIQFDEKFTGQLLVNVENGRIVRNYHLPDGAIAGSVEALLELAERARLINQQAKLTGVQRLFPLCCNRNATSRMM
ncbi:TPA: hypothetical protein ACGRO8_002367 [Escherichia coli]